MPLKKLGISLAGLVPAFVLNECLVCPQVHGRGLSAAGAEGDKFRGNCHPGSGAGRQGQSALGVNDKPLCLQHLTDQNFIVIGGLVTGTLH